MACEARRFHVPKALSTDDHHVIPQAWQRLEDKHKLFAPQTVELCPTCHRNVHYWIVRLMKALALKYSNDPLVAKKHIAGNKRLNREQKIAYDALTKYQASGRSLLALCEKGQWGFSGTRLS